MVGCWLCLPLEWRVMDENIYDESIFSDCPFCGGRPTIKKIGNDYSKKRFIEVTCKGCPGLRLRQGAIFYSHEWLWPRVADIWNKRPV